MISDVKMAAEGRRVGDGDRSRGRGRDMDRDRDIG